MFTKKYIKQIIKSVLTESNERLDETIQLLINQYLDELIIESEDWGMGEMAELLEVEDVKEIKVVDINNDNDLLVYVDVYCYGVRYDFSFVLSEIESRLYDWLKDVKLIVREIHINSKEFGPGIDW